MDQSRVHLSQVARELALVLPPSTNDTLSLKQLATALTTAPQAPVTQKPTFASSAELECYELTWPGKAQTKQEVQRKPALTLAPLNAADEGFAQARHLMVSGDPITSLQVLQRSVLGMGGIKLAFCQVERHDLERSLATLTLLRPLLRADGCCFIGCHDATALAYARQVGDEVLGVSNFIATLVWQPQTDAPLQYLVLYARTISAFSMGRLPRTEKANQRYTNPDHDPRGPWTSSDISVKTYNAACDYPITTPTGRVVHPPMGACWRLSKESFAQAVADNRIWFGASGGNVPRLKRFLSEVKESMVPTTLFLSEELGAAEPSVLTSAVAEHLLQLANLAPTTVADDVVLAVGAGSACEAMLQAVTTLNNMRASAYRCLVLPQDSPELTARHIPVRVLMPVPDLYVMRALPLSAYSQERLAMFGADTSQDALALLLAYLTRSGHDLTLSCNSVVLVGQTRSYQVLTYAQRLVWLCVESELNVDLVAALAALPLERQPQCLLCCDSGFASDAAKINFMERCATLLPQLEVKVI